MAPVVYRPVVEAAVRLIEAWQISNEKEDGLELPSSIGEEDRSHVASFAESLGLLHNKCAPFGEKLQFDDLMPR